MMRGLKYILKMLAVGILLNGSAVSCIEPPLYLPAEEVLVDMPVLITDLDVVWNLDVDWKTLWYYGWDEEDEKRWGKIEYPQPTDFEVRRYFLGDEMRAPHTNVDAFTIYDYSFRRTFMFGYYDMLLWSNIDSQDKTQVVTIDESNLDEVTASTTVTRALNLTSEGFSSPTALFNQPEIFYSACPRDIFISRNKEDYDYYDEKEGAWVKRISCELRPLVYIYMVQIILHNNDGRVVGVNGDCALTALANGTSVNTGHTNNKPCIVYFNNRMKKNIDVLGENTDIIGGKLTTYGLCDMDGYEAGTKSEYTGSRDDLPNFLYFDLRMSGGSVKSMKCQVTQQCREQCHGGIITVHLDCLDLDNPTGDDLGGMFVPTVDDYDNLEFDIPMG